MVHTASALQTASVGLSRCDTACRTFLSDFEDLTRQFCVRSLFAEHGSVRLNCYIYRVLLNDARIFWLIILHAYSLFTRLQSLISGQSNLT